MTLQRRRLAFGLTLVLMATATWSQEAPKSPAPVATRSGREIYAHFREGLADPTCDTGSSPRWLQQFSTAPDRLVAPNDDILPLFGYVVDALRAANLPTEYALIPFVESGYKPGARSPAGPAGLWQMIAVTARDHAVPIHAGYDGRLSPIDSTRAAVRYLKTLHGMFAGDWRLAVMAYNAGEYRVFSALRQSGQVARSADPEKLTTMPGIAQAYVRKLHALSCLFDQADNHSDWLQALDRQVPILEEIAVPADTTSLPAWAVRNGWDAAAIARLNPVFVGGTIGNQRQATILAPKTNAPSQAVAAGDSTPAPALVVQAGEAVMPGRPLRTHRVGRGESLQKIATHYQMKLLDLLLLNGLGKRTVLQPGMVLKLEAAPGS